jgi:hypothetical protein
MKILSDTGHKKATFERCYSLVYDQLCHEKNSFCATASQDCSSTRSSWGADPGRTALCLFVTQQDSRPSLSPRCGRQVVISSPNANIYFWEAKAFLRISKYCGFFFTIQFDPLTTFP